MIIIFQFLGFYIQKVALLANIHRWELILKVSGAIKKGLTISNDSC
jgi:hypothetical protein